MTDAERILTAVQNQPGRRARGIAEELGLSARQVNRVLYQQLQGRVRQDNNFRWWPADHYLFCDVGNGFAELRVDHQQSRAAPRDRGDDPPKAAKHEPAKLCVHCQQREAVTRDGTNLCKICLSKRVRHDNPIAGEFRPCGRPGEATPKEYDIDQSFEGAVRRREG